MSEFIDYGNIDFERIRNSDFVDKSGLLNVLNANINTLKYHVMKLREKGIIDREGSSQKGRWIVKL